MSSNVNLRYSLAVSVQQSEPLAVVVGRNCKRIRSGAGVTQDELARHARNIGLRWTASKVGDFEAGRSAPTFATVLAVILALQKALQSEVTLADLVAGDGFVILTDGIDVLATELANVCRGDVFRLQPGTWHPKVRSATAREVQALVEGDVDKLVRRSGLPEHRLAQQLGISRARLAAASFRLWQRTFREERDRRAGPDANQQKRGQMSRTLRAELEKALADGNNQ